MQTAVGVDREGASAPTLCRLEKWADRATAVRLHSLLVEQFICSFKTPPEELVLDFDATECPLHGQQEGRFFHGYYDSYCYLPLYVFCGQQLLCALLRPSRIDGACTRLVGMQHARIGLHRDDIFQNLLRRSTRIRSLTDSTGASTVAMPLSILIGIAV